MYVTAEQRCDVAAFTTEDGDVRVKVTGAALVYVGPYSGRRFFYFDLTPGAALLQGLALMFAACCAKIGWRL